MKGERCPHPTRLSRLSCYLPREKIKFQLERLIPTGTCVAESTAGCDSAVNPDGKQLDLAHSGAGRLEEIDSRLGRFFVMTPTNIEEKECKIRKRKLGKGKRKGGKKEKESNFRIWPIKILKRLKQKKNVTTITAQKLHRGLTGVLRHFHHSGPPSRSIQKNTASRIPIICGTI